MVLLQPGLQIAPSPSPLQTTCLGQWPGWRGHCIPVRWEFWFLSPECSLVRISRLTEPSVLCCLRWVCIFSSRTCCDFSGRTSPFLWHYQKQTPEDFYSCLFHVHHRVRSGSLCPALICPSLRWLQWASTPQHPFLWLASLLFMYRLSHDPWV